jgi:hypothetical protein
MKAIVTFLLALFTISVSAQDQPKTLSVDQLQDFPQRNIISDSPVAVPDLKISECYAAAKHWYWQVELKQPTQVEELPNGTMPLSESLPYVHTLRGATYTYDHLRYTVRN